MATQSESCGLPASAASCEHGTLPVTKSLAPPSPAWSRAAGSYLYALPKHSRSERHQLAEIAARSPRGVFCLLTALRFHELTTQSPHEVWLAIANKARPPKLDYPPLRLVRFSGQALTKGIETHLVDGVTIRVYSVAKTVADCFKYRNKTGLDVALEALRESRREKQATNDELWRYAKICRVANVMRPYMESLE
jgi:predicted transcriptional regulator of viral defense system